MTIHGWTHILKRAEHFIFPSDADNLKSDSHLQKKFMLFTSMESALKMMKNAFYFILKALFVVKIFKFLSWIFCHVEKTAWLERYDEFQNSWRHNLVNKQSQ